MNILFMTLSRIETIDKPSIYCDLLRCFRAQGHKVYVISPYEKRTGLPTTYREADGVCTLSVATGNMTKVKNLIEKGLATLSIEPLFIRAIKKYFKDVRFDLVIYSTPPITFCKAIKYVQKRDGAKTYLLLKDIFPQNAVDIGMMRKSGIKGLIYKYFRRKEKKLYALSDRIGCMSQANVDFVLKHNPEIDAAKVEICPNTIAVQDLRVTAEDRAALRMKYGIPLDKKVFVYGGNLGKPQGISFVIECLKQQKNNPDAFFLLVGGGTERKKLESFLQTENPENVVLLDRLPREDYDKMVGACDVGMIFLDHRFTIPNFPSRLLSYLQAGLPVLCCTDPNTDIGTVCVEGGFGWWCESNSAAAFGQQVENALQANLPAMGETGFAYLQENYPAERSYRTIMAHLGGK